MAYWKTQASTVCLLKLYTPGRETLVKPNYNRELAANLLSHHLSVNALWDLLLATWFSFEGVFHDFNREPIDLWSYDENGDDFIDRLAGDPVRSLRRYLEFGQTTRVNRLRKEHHNLAMMLHHARSIQECRHAGLCSARNQ